MQQQHGAVGSQTAQHLANPAGLRPRRPRSVRWPRNQPPFQPRQVVSFARRRVAGALSLDRRVPKVDEADQRRPIRKAEMRAHPRSKSGSPKRQIAAKPRLCAVSSMFWIRGGTPVGLRSRRAGRGRPVRSRRRRSPANAAPCVAALRIRPAGGSAFGQPTVDLRLRHHRAKLDPRLAGHDHEPPRFGDVMVRRPGRGFEHLLIEAAAERRPSSC